MRASTLLLYVTGGMILAACSTTFRAAARRTVFTDQGWSEPARQGPSDARRSSNGQQVTNLRPSPLAPPARIGRLDGPQSAAADGDGFLGHDRRIAKTTSVSGLPHPYALTALLAEFKPGKRREDARMRALPAMCKEPTCDRVSEEREAVVVEGWFIAAKKEEDNDFHVILAADASLADAQEPDRWQLMNVEISGLGEPGAPGYDAIAGVRRTFRESFVPPVADRAGRGYTALEPVHVRVTGSLFFDLDHPAGAVGPGSFKPATSWEIHPVTKLEILN